jgi:hypothetical protein
MGKGRKRQRDKAPQQPAVLTDSDAVIDDAPLPTASGQKVLAPRPARTRTRSSSLTAAAAASSNNPLWHQQQAFLQSLTESERTAFFDDKAVDPNRRADIWMQQADLGERLVNDCAWATPTDNSLAVLAHFGPIIEMGCGANAYWCRQMQAASIDVVGYDVSPRSGGTIKEPSKKSKQTSKNKGIAVGAKDFCVQRGDPQVLADPQHQNRTLFLCYPDENSAMAASCLDYYTGDVIIHVGELIAQATEAPILSRHDAPWGRSTAPDFQERLLSEFHCLLTMALPNWLHTSDCLSVWKRSATTTIVFAAEDENDQDEEVEYRYIPLNERLPTDRAAPCLQHLLNSSSKPAPSKHVGLPVDTTGNIPSKPVGLPVDTTGDISERRSGPTALKSKKTTRDVDNKEEEASQYECPW